MTVSTQVALDPWTVPNFVRMTTPPGKREDGFPGAGTKESPGFSLHELDPTTLSHQVERFREGVFRKAEKKDPCSLEKLGHAFHMAMVNLAQEFFAANKVEPTEIKMPEAMWLALKAHALKSNGHEWTDPNYLGMKVIIADDVEMS